MLLRDKTIAEFDDLIYFSSKEFVNEGTGYYRCSMVPFNQRNILQRIVIIDLQLKSRLCLVMLLRKDRIYKVQPSRADAMFCFCHIVIDRLQVSTLRIKVLFSVIWVPLRMKLVFLNAVNCIENQFQHIAPVTLKEFLKYWVLE